MDGKRVAAKLKVIFIKHNKVVVEIETCLNNKTTRARFTERGELEFDDYDEQSDNCCVKESNDGLNLFWN